MKSILRFLLWLSSALPLAAALAPINESVLEPEALNFARGTYGTCINGQTFQLEAILSHKGWQYATWFNAQGQVCIGRRKLPTGEWQRAVFTNYQIKHTDTHNVSVLGICPLDGTIHLAFDHHVTPLHYRVSRPGIANTPEQVTWSTNLFSATTNALVPGREMKGVTYPLFFNTPDGRLQLYYRVGGSGNGDSYLAEYNPAKGGWSMTGMFISGKGDYQGSPARNAYHNGFDYGPKGRLHTTWVWREELDNAKWSVLNCHDLQYAYSDDDGHSWRNQAGEQVGVTGQSPMSLASPKLIVKPLTYRWGMMNQLTQVVDSRDRVHAIMWHKPLDAPAEPHDRSTWRYFHYWNDEQGRWHEQQLPCFGRKPYVLADANDNLVIAFTKPANLEYHGFDPGGPLHIATASAKANWQDWHVVFSSKEACVGEPRLDRNRFRDERVLSVYAQEAPAEPGKPSRLRVLDFKF